MTFTVLFQTFGPMLLQTTLVLGVASIVALALLRVSNCRRPWVHQFLWGGVLLLGLVGMRIPYIVPMEVDAPVESVPVASTESEQKSLDRIDHITPEDVSVLPSTEALDQHPAEFVPTVEASEFLSVKKPESSVELEQPTLPARAGFVAESLPVLEPSSTEIAKIDRVSKFDLLPISLFYSWLTVLTGLLAWNFARYAQLLRLLKKAESPDVETENLWNEILERGGVVARKRPPIKILPEGGPAMIRTPSGYTLVLSKSHWNELDAELRRGVMRHELAHFLHGDLWKTLFARLVVLLHWFNPFAYLAVRRFEEAIEWSADSFSYGTEEKGLEQFAAAMLTLHETTPQNYRYRVAFGTKDILRRLEFLKRLKSGSKESLLKTGLVLVFSLLLLGLGALNIRIVAQEKKPQPTVDAVVLSDVKDEKKDNPTEIISLVNAAGKNTLPNFSGSIYDKSPHRDLLNDMQIVYVSWDEATFKRYYETAFCRMDKPDAEAESEWIALLKKREPLHRRGDTEFYRAINGLAMLKSETAIPDLLHIATERIHKDNSYRHNSIKALGWIGNPKVVPDLIPMLYFMNFNCRLEAQVALVRLTGQNFGYDWKAWGTWWNENRRKFGDDMPEFDMKFVDWLNVGYIWYITDDLKQHFDYDRNPELKAYADPEVQKIQDRLFLLEKGAELELKDRRQILGDELKKAIAERTGIKERKIEEINESNSPKIVSTNPSNGAVDVDPSLTAISVTFDRPMGSGIAWYTKDGGKTFPKRTKSVDESFQWSEDRKTNTITDLVLEPGKTYNIWLNTEEELNSNKRYDGFRSENDVPLKPVLFTFTTKAKTAAKSENATPMLLTVLDADGKPIAGATGHASRVDRDDKRPGGNFKTDEKGQAKIGRTKPDNAAWACFNIKTAGYTPYFAVWERNSKSEYPPDEFTVKLDKAKTIGGIVLDADGKPIRDVDVEFSFPYGERSFNDNSTGCAAKGKTDAEGRWTCGYVPMDVLGSMRFYLHHSDFQSTQVEVDLDDLKADTDGKYSHVITIQRGYEITGLVKDENGKPIANARVEIQFFGINGSEKDMYRRTATDAEGRYRFATCPLTDNAAVVAQAPGFAGQYVETSIGSAPKAVDIVLYPSKPLKLRIADEQGNPVKNPQVSVSRWGPFDGMSIAPPINKMLKAENYEPLKLDDGDGNWGWNDALTGKFQIAVGADGFMSQQYVDVEAGAEVQTIVMKPWLHVMGTVVDDETGKPIPTFRLVEGFGNVAKGAVSWQTSRIRDEKDGAFLLIDSWPQRFGRKLRVEADGYENGDSRLIENEEGSIELTFRMKMKRAEEKSSEKLTDTVRSGIVLTPDGKPTADVRILVSTYPDGIYVAINNLDHHIQTKSDRDGKFTLPAFQTIKRNDLDKEPANSYALVLIHEDGCRYLTGKDFEKNHNSATDAGAQAIQLEPWCELEGTLSIGNRPGEGAQISVYRMNRNVDPDEFLRFEFNADTATGKDGRFAIRKLFPGDYSVSRYIVLQRSGGSTRLTGALSKQTTVRSGEKTEIKLGGTGRPVIGRFQGSQETERLLNNGTQSVRIHAPSPKFPDFPRVPDEVNKFQIEKDPVKARELYAAWEKSEAGKKYLADQKAVLKEIEVIRQKNQEDRRNSYGGAIKGDGLFRIEDVESGDWVLEINAFDEEKQLQIQFEQPFSIPEMPGGRSDEPLDLGTIQVASHSTKLPEPRRTTREPAADVMTLKVFDSKEKPIAGAAVEFVTFPRVVIEVVTGELLESRGRIHQVKTDGNGRLGIRLPKDTPKSMSYSLNIDGYAPAWLRWKNIEKRSDLPNEYIVKLDDARTVGGVLVDEDGKPVKDAVVVPRVRPIQRPEDSQSVGGGRSCTTDAEGRWIFCSIPASYKDLNLEIMHPDFMAFRPTVSTADYLVQKDATPEKTLTLPRGRTVMGTTTDSDGKPIVGAVVRTIFLNDKRETKTDENGVYRLAGVPVGEMNLVVTSPQKAPGLKRMDVMPEMPQEISNVDFRLEPGGIVRLHVVDIEGNPCPKASISFGDWLGEFRGFALSVPNTETDDQGRWTWNEAPRKEFTIDVYKTGKRTARVKIAPREEPYTITMKPPFEMTGNVTDEVTGKTIENYTLVPAWISPGNYYPDGKYTGDIVNWVRNSSQNVTMAEYRFTTTDNTTKAYRIRIEAPGYLAAESRDILPDEVNVRIDFKLKKGKPAESSVFLPGDGNTPASRAKVYLLDSGSQANIKLGKMELELSGTGTESDENGRFTLPAWDKPFWIWVLHEKGFARLKPDELKPDEGIRLTAWSRIEGTVYKGSKPAAGEKVFLNSFGKPEKYDTWGDDVPNFHLGYETVSDENGNFSFDYVVPGSGTACRVIEDVTSQKTGRGGGRYAYFKPFDVKPGETATIKIGGRGRPVVGKIETEKTGLDWSQIVLVSDDRSPISLGAAVEADSRFRIEDVPPGTHNMILQDRNGRNPLPSLKITIDMPEMPGDQNDVPLLIRFLE